MEKRFSIVIAFFAILGLLLSVGTCYAASDSDTLRIANPSDVKKLDPIHIMDAPSSRVADLICDHLATYDYSGEVVPELAKSWEFSEEGDEITFYLREDVKFHDGTEFDAEAVKFNFERILDPDEASSAREKYSEVIEDIEVVDDYTIRFELTAPNAAFIDLYIIDNATMIISPASVEKYGEDVALNPVGTGPFEFDEYKQASHVRLLKNEDYWDGAPKLEEVVFKPIPELQSRIAELESGGVDLIFRVPPEQLEGLEQHSDISLQKSPYPSIRGLWFNLGRDVFEDKQVRKALAYGVDSDTIHEALLQGVAVPGKSIVPVESWAYNEDVPKYGFDMEKAARLLDEAGWVDEDGDGVREKGDMELSFTIMSPDGRYLRDKEICEAVTHNWEDLGVEAKTEVLEWGGFIDNLFAEEFEMVFLGWMQSTFEPAKFINPMVKTGGRSNYFNYSNSELDELLEQGTRTFDQEQRKEIYAEAQEVYMEDAHFISLYNHLGIVAHNKDLKDYRYTASRSLDLLQAYKES
ncbi:MAG: ABC transporter substrate-binding protein [Candidatus Acetothermia bacterium]